MYIGKKLKEIRKSKGITLVELSEKSQVQVATLSRIENLKMTGTVESHMAIAKGLGIDVLQLYADIVNEEKTVERSEGTAQKDIFIHSDKASFEILTTNVLKKKMMPTLLTLEHGGQTNAEQSVAGTEKFILVMEGEAKVMIGETPYSLSKGNSIYFDASLKHYFQNEKSRQTKILIISTPAAL
ncbi:MAG: helix-turn-helix transcriptional regulator [Candidatus Omnitrophica bacterium]|nr:helix-turn-helix transcriptional regulator [Candidatus Omnitrophota bacterium]